MSNFAFSQEPVLVPQVNSKYRRIKTEIPAPEAIPLLQKIKKYESSSMHGQMPIVWDRAEDFQVFDAWGNIWIDFTSTIFLANAGHGNKRVVKEIRNQLDKPLLHTYSYATEIRAQYLQYLIEATPQQFEKAFLISAGTESTEVALKLTRLRAEKINKRKPGIIGFEGNWHGRTLGAQMLSHAPDQKGWIGYLDPNIYHLAFPYPWIIEVQKNPKKFFNKSIDRLLNEKKINPEKDLCGMIFETFQGWGAIFYPPEFVQEAVRFAHDNGMLVIFDEMQAGFGRTGTLFGYMHYNVEPDLLCCGKGASSSVPLSFVIGKKEVMDLPEIGSMSSTHSANPIACAAGLSNLKALLEDGILDNVKHLELIFMNKLHKIKDKYPRHIKYVQGKGLVAALIFQDPDNNPLADICNQVCEEALRRGLLLVHTGRESIKMGPPLTIPKEALSEGLEVLSDCIEFVINKEVPFDN